MRVHTTDSQHG
jgi:putative transposase